MDLKKLTLIELKAAAWDFEYNLRAVNNELNIRLSNPPVDDYDDTKPQSVGVELAKKK
jgi:hypothetical protein